jgi:predicted GIY-YIG superfamily endonuclease
MNRHPHDTVGVAGTVYVLHFEPAYRHARHYIGWALDVDARLELHRRGRGPPLIAAVIDAGVELTLAATFSGSRHLERRLKRWPKTAQLCPVCRAVPARAS